MKTAEELIDLADIEEADADELLRSPVPRTRQQKASRLRILAEAWRHTDSDSPGAYACTGVVEEEPMRRKT